MYRARIHVHDIHSLHTVHQGTKYISRWAPAVCLTSTGTWVADYYHYHLNRPPSDRPVHMMAHEAFTTAWDWIVDVQHCPILARWFWFGCVFSHGSTLRPNIQFEIWSKINRSDPKLQPRLLPLRVIAFLEWALAFGSPCPDLALEIRGQMIWKVFRVCNTVLNEALISAIYQFNPILRILPNILWGGLISQGNHTGIYSPWLHR